MKDKAKTPQEIEKAIISLLDGLPYYMAEDILKNCTHSIRLESVVKVQKDH